MWKPFPAIQLMAPGCQSALGVQQSSEEASGAAMAGRVRRRVLSQSRSPCFMTHLPLGIGENSMELDN